MNFQVCILKDDYHCAGCCGYLTLPWSFQKNCNKKSTYTFSPHYPFRQFKIAGHGVLLWKFAKCSPHFGSQHNELNEIEILWEYNSNFQQTLKLATITSAAAASLQQHSFFGQNRKLIKTTFINTFPLEPTLSHLFWCAFICSPLFFTSRLQQALRTQFSGDCLFIWSLRNLAYQIDSCFIIEE